MSRENRNQAVQEKQTAAVWDVLKKTLIPAIVIAVMAAMVCGVYTLTKEPIAAAEQAAAEAAAASGKGAEYTDVEIGGEMKAVAAAFHMTLNSIGSSPEKGLLIDIRPEMDEEGALQIAIDTTGTVTDVKSADLQEDSDEETEDFARFIGMTVGSGEETETPEDNNSVTASADETALVVEAALTIAALIR